MNRNKIVLTTCNSRSAGGLCGAIAGLTKAANSNHRNIDLFSYNDQYSDVDWPQYGNTVNHDYTISNIPVLSSLGVSSDLGVKLEEMKPEVIDVQGLWMYHSYAALRYQKNHPATKKVITPHGMLDPWAVKNSGWKKKIVGHLFEYENLRTADCFKALCKSEYESIRAFGLKNPVAIIPNGINLPEGVTFNRHGEKKAMLFVGRIHPKKGIKELIEGLAIVKDSHPDLLDKWQIRIAGWDQLGHTEELIALSESKGLRDSVKFIGSVFGEDKKRELCNANAFVLTSYSEGLPMSILEAWAYQLPVLMTDYCNIPEGFEADAAVRVDTAPESIAEGLIKMFQMEDVALQQIGVNGYNLVKEKFTWDHIADQTLELYRWVVEGGEKPDFVYLD